MASQVAHERKIILCRYWNNGGHQVAVVATVNRFGDLGDWGAYIGASGGSQNTYEDTKQTVANYGAKLTREEAEALVPEHIRESIGLPYRD